MFTHRQGVGKLYLAILRIFCLSRSGAADRYRSGFGEIAVVGGIPAADSVLLLALILALVIVFDSSFSQLYLNRRNGENKCDYENDYEHEHGKNMKSSTSASRSTSKSRGTSKSRNVR
jgi:hypothetical protein